MDRMVPDIKYRILIALYLEYLRTVPDNSRISQAVTGIENHSWFFNGLRKLEIEGYITGMPPVHTNAVFQNLDYNMEAVSITRHGIETIENLFKLNFFDDAETKLKLMKLAKTVAPPGFSDFVAALCDKLQY